MGSTAARAGVGGRLGCEAVLLLFPNVSFAYTHRRPIETNTQKFFHFFLNLQNLTRSNEVPAARELVQGSRFRAIRWQASASRCRHSASK